MIKPMAEFALTDRVSLCHERVNLQTQSTTKPALTLRLEMLPVIYRGSVAFLVLTNTSYKNCRAKRFKETKKISNLQNHHNYALETEGERGEGREAEERELETEGERESF